MLKNHIKIAWRSLKKHPFFTFLNIFGLAIGMAGCLLISMYIYDELSFDGMFPDGNRIHRINIDNTNGGETNKYASVAAPLGHTLMQDYPQIEMVTRFRDMSSILLRKTEAKQNIKENHIIGVDSTFFDMFGLTLLKGNPETALKAPKTLILTQTAAQKHFGSDRVLGQTLLLDNKDVYTVTGVIDDLPENSFLRNHTIFISMTSFPDAESPSWANWNYSTFIKLHSEASIQSLNAPLKNIYETYMIPWIQTFDPSMTLKKFRESRKASGNNMVWSTTPLTDIHLYSSNRKGELSPNNDIENIYILSAIGLFLIILASVNFVNLSTAQALKRVKEIGIRKTLGSKKIGLIKQFLTEAVTISFLSLVMALAITAIALPFFNELSGKGISLPLNSPLFWGLLLVSAILLGLFSGSYPAFFLSKFAPIITLKGGSKSGTGNSRVRNYLVIFQFAISVSLIIGTLVVFQQLQFIQSKDLGFKKDQVLIIDDVDASGDKIQSLKQEVEKVGHVKSVSLSSFLPTPSARNGITFFPEAGSGIKHDGYIFEKWRVDHDYMNTLGMKIIVGRNFDRQLPTDSSSIILNESAVAMLGLQNEDALGARLSHDFKRPDKENMEYLTVIGVVENFHFESLRNNINAMSLSLGRNSNKMLIKLNHGDFKNTIAQIKQIWNTMAPHQPFQYYFMDDSFNDTYKAEQQLGSIFVVFTFLSILIACLGLFGLAVFNAEKRTKEIGIRKVLGANVGQITYKLIIDFLKLVGVAILVSLPIGWFAMNKWLEDFSYRIEIEWWVFAIASLLAIVIALLTVGLQSVKAAIVNPTKSLRTE
ncbi:FtsX-like permease family protein [Flagellimonas hymeniacidonis]|uniref:FtsX-like permease family protein n=1 Tax=Flagellimonas hymeniacidonis TaxID=2603628 RepID=A0A5C8V8S4_9FLAO|nr:ABC transporter permease [Flagellimonas hymeniacidonis]TXN37776.1 FtsX-like permease family protein [Flagellimonas hymeniacidonis]